jgi:hypothetical protein
MSRRLTTSTAAVGEGTTMDTAGAVVEVRRLSRWLPRPHSINDL